MALKPLSELSTEPLKIKRALLSVSDKTGITDLAAQLHQLGIELISTGGTARTLRAEGYPVKDVSEVTGFPECLDGRVKTLHPSIHGGILARTTHQPDVNELKLLEIDPIELVVVNLYPFKEQIAKEGISPAEATEYIDIGGPTMIRAAAKNFAHVTVCTSPGEYEIIISELKKEGAITFDTRRMLAKKAFEHTADYDQAISRYFDRITPGTDELPRSFYLGIDKQADLRYGENPHQIAAIYGNQNDYIKCFHGKELSYNNYLDIDSALGFIEEFGEDETAVAIFKHTLPCGAALAGSVKEAYQQAFASDRTSPFGGIIISNQKIDEAAAREMDTIFTEIILAPDFDESALNLLKKKKNRRLVKIHKLPGSNRPFKIKSIFGGLLLQQPDSEIIDTGDFKVVTQRKPTDQELEDLLFSWKVVKHVKSNAIVFAKNSRTLGVGAGQPSRVDSSEIAVRKAKNEGNDLNGSVVASDAFFPFADGIEAAAKAGCKAVIQPGGSIRDDEVIKAADHHKMAMVFTGKRHFRH